MRQRPETKRLLPGSNISKLTDANIPQALSCALKLRREFAGGRFAGLADGTPPAVIAHFGVSLTPVLYLDILKYAPKLPASSCGASVTLRGSQKKSNASFG